MRIFFAALLLGFLAVLPNVTAAEPKNYIKVEENDDYVQIDTDALQARVRKKGYVSGVEKGTFLDKKTGARELGFGLHIMDFLLAPGWRNDGYSRDAKLHGDLLKHYVEGPQICTKAKELKAEVVKMPGHIRHKDGDNFTQVYLSYRAKPIPAAEFKDDFAPDAKFLYQCQEGKVPERMIRAYQVKLDGKPGPWLAGMTLDPAEVAEAWCHQRGYVSFILE
jgi:hypothetical protein